MPPPSASASSSPRAGLWLTGAAALALAVQAIFVLMPAPQSAGATDAADAAAPGGAAEVVADSAAFLLEDDTTPLPGEGPATDSTVERAATALVVDSLPAVVLPDARTITDGASVGLDSAERQFLPPDSSDAARRR